MTDEVLPAGENTGKNEVRRANGRFVKGQSGNPSGRPKGSRNVLSKSVLGTYAKEAANGDFERVMAELKQHNPAAYAKLLNDAAMKEAERTASAPSGLCEECGGEIAKTILSVQFVDVGLDHPSKNHANSDTGEPTHPAKQEACQLSGSSEEVPSGA